MTIIFIAFALINVVLAFIDAHKIIKSKSIKHWLNGLIYAGMAAIPFFLFKNYWMVGAILFIRLTVFNIALSLFRGLKWDYISPMPAAVTDRIARKVFGGNGKLMYAIYTVILIAFVLKSFL